MLCCAVLRRAVLHNAVSCCVFPAQVYQDNTRVGCWLAPDGAKHNYGDPLEDFFDPEGEGSPFIGDDSEPDEEKYECYTGNEGGRVVYVSVSASVDISCSRYLLSASGRLSRSGSGKVAMDLGGGRVRCMSSGVLYCVPGLNKLA